MPKHQQAAVGSDEEVANEIGRAVRLAMNAFDHIALPSDEELDRLCDEVLSDWIVDGGKLRGPKE